MGRISYTETTFYCPHCNQKLKTSSDAWLTLLGIVFFVFVVPAFLAIWAISALLKTSVPKLGSPLTTCPHCQKQFKSGKKMEWQSFDDNDKKSWSFRRSIFACYCLGVLDIFALIMTVIGIFASNTEDDWTIFFVVLIIFVLLTLLIAFFVFAWKKYQKESYIIMSSADYELVKQSNARTNNTANEYPPIKLKDTGLVVGQVAPTTNPSTSATTNPSNTASPAKSTTTNPSTSPATNNPSTSPTKPASSTAIHQTRKQRWQSQAQIDDSILNSDTPAAKRFLQAAAEINALWEVVSEPDIKNSNTKFYSELCLRSLTAELFLQNYYLFKEGDPNEIKDSIYQQRPHIVHDALINMGIFIFQTQNNTNILNFIIDSYEPDFLSAKPLARQILEQENQS